MQYAQESLRRARELQQKLNAVRQSKTIDTSPPPGNALLADRSFNERELPSNPRIADCSGDRADYMKSPMTVAAGGQLNLSVVSQASKPLPEKLAKMRDRVKRERSANLYYREPSREDSLYGRKRASYEIEKVRKSAKSTILAK